MSAEYRSIPDAFYKRVAATPDRVAFRSPSGGGWRSDTWKDIGDRVRNIAAGLRELGLADEQRCAIASGTRLDWIVVDLGVLCGGGATTTIYPSCTGEECEYILNDSESLICFAENDEQVQKIVGRRAQLKHLKRVVVIDGAGGHDGWVMSLAELEQLGKARRGRDPDELERIVKSIAPTSLATLIYTSGTTGRPKGVELTHDNWVYEGGAIKEMGLITPEDEQYLWLPLSHSFGKVLQVAQIIIGFPTAVDGRVDKIVENLAIVRPTFVAAVPRIFEKVHAKVMLGAKEGSGLKQGIFAWAMDVGKRCSAHVQKGESIGLALGLQQRVADRLVFSKLRARFGGRIRFFVSGSAPLARELAEFFHAAGILVCEGYGLTESSAASFVNRPEKYRFGTVGMPVPGTKVKIAEDGEILIGGRGIMRGYRGLPTETSEALKDGWLQTGDIGEIDADGFLRITDRKKDLIKTSGGKYVAPQMIEGKLKASSPFVSQVLVHGNNRNYCTALVSFDPEALTKWAASQGLSGSYAELAARPEARALLEPAFAQVNAELPSYSTVKKFAVLPADLTQEAGDLTPSLKLKRKVVEQKYKALIDGLYAGGRD